MISLLLALAPQVPGGFEAGDIVVRDPGTPRFQLVDPIDGATSDLVYDVQQFDGKRDAYTYDPVRDRLVFLAILSTGVEALCVGNAFGVHEVLATWASFGPSGAFAATDDGRVYWCQGTAVYYVDLAGTIHLVGDGAGGTFHLGYSSNTRYMEYDPQSNSLVYVGGNGASPCMGSCFDVRVRRLDLSEDGADIVSEDCTSFDVGAFLGGNGTPRGLAYVEPGELLLMASGTESGTSPTTVLKRIEPTGSPGGTLQVTDWVTTSLSAGTPEGLAYSYVLDQAVALNQFSTTLYTFDEGDTSPGFITTPVANLGDYGLVDIRSAGTKGLFPVGPGGQPGSGPSKVSVGAGGQQDLQVDFGPANAGDFFFLTGSFSGFTPTPFGGLSVPVTFDPYTNFTIQAPNSPVLVNSFGLLDGQGRGQCSFVLAPGAPSSLVGMVAHHSAVRIDSGTATLKEATSAVSLSFVP